MECIYEKQKTIFFKKTDLSFILIKLRKTEFNGGLVTSIVCFFFFLIFLTIIIFLKITMNTITKSAKKKLVTVLKA